jgi:hypothetical protein
MIHGKFPARRLTGKAISRILTDSSVNGTGHTGALYSRAARHCKEEP